MCGRGLQRDREAAGNNRTKKLDVRDTGGWPELTSYISINPSLHLGIYRVHTYRQALIIPLLLCVSPAEAEVWTSLLLNAPPLLSFIPFPPLTGEKEVFSDSTDKCLIQHSCIPLPEDPLWLHTHTHTQSRCVKYSSPTRFIKNETHPRLCRLCFIYSFRLWKQKTGKGRGKD